MRDERTASFMRPLGTLDFESCAGDSIKRMSWFVWASCSYQRSDVCGTRIDLEGTHNSSPRLSFHIT